MKKLITLSISIALTFWAYAQSPEFMSYQCVVRDAGGELITKQNIGVRTTILKGTMIPMIIYQETYSPLPVTNENGLMTLVIGTSKPGDGSEARANAWNLLSDERLKKNLIKLTDPLEMLDKINGYYFHWNTGINHKRETGFSAQEVREVLPEVVSEGGDGYLSIDYGKMTPLITEAIKELRAENEKLKIRIEKFEAEIGK